MADPKYNFQYCQKLVIFSEDWQSVLLAKRQGEADYDGAFSFIGGKMEVSDQNIVDGLRREKDEEIGQTVKVRVYLQASNNVLFHKADGSSMIVPHYLAQFIGGEIQLSTEEYSEYRWVKVADLAGLEPKIENIPKMVDWALRLKPILDPQDFVEI